MRIKPTISHFLCVKARVHIKERKKKEEKGRREEEKKKEEKKKTSKGMESTYVWIMYGILMGKNVWNGMKLMFRSVVS